MAIKSYTSVAASNTSLFPENMAPSAVNDGARTVQSDIVTQFRDAEWVDFGHSVSRASASTFKIAADVTANYLVNRRIRCNDASTLYGVITASSYSAPDTTVTVGLDSGSLTASLTAVSLAILAPTNISVPTTIGRKGADIASAATVDLTTATGDFVDVTGTTTITAFGTIAAGVERTVRFTGALTLTHNGTSLILPGGANITTAANDRAIFRSLGSGNWLCVAYIKANGKAVIETTHVLVQRIGNSTGAVATGTTTMPFDDTIPQNTEGDQYLTQAITPNNSSNILIIDVIANVASSATGHLGMALFQDSTANALNAVSHFTNDTGSQKQLIMRHVMTAGTTSSTTFNVRIGNSAAATVTFNGVGGARRYGGVMLSSIEIREYSS